MLFIVKQQTSLLEQLKLLFPDSSTSTLRSMLKNNRVLVDGKKMVHANNIVQPGQKLEILEKKIPQPKELVDVIFEDEHLVLVEKPSGLLSVATDFGTEKSAHGFLKKRNAPDKVFVIHRLDKETSGLILFAYSQKAFTILKDDLKDRKIKRLYYGVVEGVFEGSGIWSNYLYEDKNYHVHVTLNEHLGERAVTKYTVIGHNDTFSLVAFELDTGKKNQIRVQAAHAGHPIAGDFKYGAQKQDVKRLCLHAKELHFTHPITKKSYVFSSNVPTLFSQLIK